MFSCDEHLAGRDPRRAPSSALCRVHVFAGARSGHHRRPAFGDRLEKLAFNALPGTFTDDMWAHQYNQEPNQVECSLHHKPWTTDGPESNLFGLEPNFGCCTANFHQGWPKFAASLFYAVRRQDSDQHDGLFAAAYAPCEVHTCCAEPPVHIAKRPTTRFAEREDHRESRHRRSLSASLAHSCMG